VPTFFVSKDHPEYSTAIPAVDVETQVQHAIFLARAGIAGIVLLGSTGEAVHLTAVERVSLISAVRKGLAHSGFPEYPILAGTSTQSMEEAIVQIGQAKQAGAQWAMVLAPGYFAGAHCSQDGIFKFFETIAERSELPILV
jgi:2-keto-3-deoxy-L-rhamnonate aldolase